MNYQLCFSTVQTILDWVASNPEHPTPALIQQFELLRADVDLKIHALKKRQDKIANMGLKDTP